MFKGEFIMEPEKLVMYMVIAVSACMMGMVAITEWHKNDCKIELAKSTRTVIEINEICR
jgi:Flp pilus assembly protein CpaB